jgi:hypothetical protein
MDLLYIVLGFLAIAVPVTIIFLTLKYIRKKRESGVEKSDREHHDKSDLTDQLKSVKEERIEKKGIDKTKN